MFRKTRFHWFLCNSQPGIGSRRAIMPRKVTIGALARLLDTVYNDDTDFPLMSSLF